MLGDHAVPIIEFEEEADTNTYKLNLEELTNVIGNEAIANKKVTTVFFYK